jgi:hypothetical protein
MLGMDDSYGQACAFVQGVNVGSDWALLPVFREWLVMRLGFGNNLGWQTLVLRLTFPSPGHKLRELLDNPQNNRKAVDNLFRLLEEYLDLQKHPGAVDRIREEHSAWLRSQSWYRE